ncbi:MAG: DUF885 domain-containing protein [Ilumatobacteraceae bacterium]
MSHALALADEYWDYYRATAQLWNIDRGDVDQIEHWEDLSPAGVARRLERLASFAARSRELATSAELNDLDRGLLGAVEFSADSTSVLLPFERDLGLVAGPFDFATFVTILVPGYSLTTRAHGQGYVAKLSAIPAFVDGWIAGLRDGAASGRSATARGIAGSVAALDGILSLEPADHPLAAQDPPSQLSESEIATWRSQIDDTIRTTTQPALAQLRAFLHDELLPIGRPDDRCGVCHMPGGDEGYAGVLWASTSTELTAREVHEVGLRQLGLLDQEYRELGAEATGTSDPVSLRERLRTDMSLRYTAPEEIAAAAMAALARAEDASGDWFVRLPRGRCNAVAVASGPMAFYTGPSPDGNRGGTFFYNTANTSAWTRFQLEVTTFHEAVPGHHLQVALAGEYDLHPVVGELEVTSYGEGWGLYAERLADEMGLYSSPLQRIGMLTLDSLRAARLVVDTGVHALGWTRDEAIEFIIGNTTMDRGMAATEVDRYVAQPGQATSYMIGRLEIDRLRRRAADALGPRFSIKEFHDVVLGNGMTPLGQLAHNVDAWTAAHG